MTSAITANGCTSCRPCSTSGARPPSTFTTPSCRRPRALPSMQGAARRGDRRSRAPSASRVLAPADMVLHSAVHLFTEGEFSRGLRDLCDLDLAVARFRRPRSAFLGSARSSARLGSAWAGRSITRCGLPRRAGHAGAGALFGRRRAGAVGRRRDGRAALGRALAPAASELCRRLAPGWRCSCFIFARIICVCRSGLLMPHLLRKALLRPFRTRSGLSATCRNCPIPR